MDLRCDWTDLYASSPAFVFIIAGESSPLPHHRVFRPSKSTTSPTGMLVESMVQPRGPFLKTEATPSYLALVPSAFTLDHAPAGQVSFLSALSLNPVVL